MKKLNRYSSQVTQPENQGHSQAMLYATGLNEEDLSLIHISEPTRPY